MVVRFLVDGNNLMFALADVGVDADRRKLSRLLGDFAEREGANVTVVFDGPAPKDLEAERIADLRISAYYSGRRTADDVLADLTESYSAPRQLAVVSSDRAVQRQAKRRRCKVIAASDFARQLKARPADKANGEPAAKRHGLEEGRLEHWLEEFGFVGENDSE